LIFGGLTGGAAWLVLIPLPLLSLSLANLQYAFIFLKDKSSCGDIGVADLTDRSFIPAGTMVGEEPLGRVASVRALLTADTASEGEVLPVRIPHSLLLQVLIIVVDYVFFLGRQEFERSVEAGVSKVIVEHLTVFDQHLERELVDGLQTPERHVRVEPYRLIEELHARSRHEIVFGR
jgi:hypothetical protein